MSNEIAKETKKAARVKITEGMSQMNMTLQQALSLFGCDSEAIPLVAVNQLINTIPGMALDENGENKANAALAMLTEIAPRDGLEGMLAAQMVAVHNLSLECARRAVLPEQTTEGVNDGINRTTKLMRTFTAQMEALQRYRNGGKQNITVQHQHVNVENGGQAIVGNVNKGAGNG